MVAMVIGLIGMIIILQVFEVSEGIKRTTTSGGDAQQNGAIATYVLEHDIRNSGAGFNDTPWAGCTMVGWDANITPSDFPAAGATMLLTPVRILSGATSTTPDEIIIAYGSQPQAGNGSSLSTTMTASTDPLRVNSIYGYKPGDLVVVMESPPPLPALPKVCSIMEITSIAGDQLFHINGSYTYTPPGGSPTTVPSRFNKPGGLGTVYVGGPGATQKTMVYNVGTYKPGPTMFVYSDYKIAKQQRNGYDQHGLRTRGRSGRQLDRRHGGPELVTRHRGPHRHRRAQRAEGKILPGCRRPLRRDAGGAGLDRKRVVRHALESQDAPGPHGGPGLAVLPLPRVRSDDPPAQLGMELELT
jgi:hypothetical protein